MSDTPTGGAPLRIAYITAGAAGMYCGSCLHDNTLAATLIRMGHDVALIPTYTPIRTDETDVSIGRVFYGAINVYLEQRSSLFRHTPWLFDRLLSGRRLLNWASSHGASVDARELGRMTLSVLQGEQGNQRKELERLVAWLEDYRPQIVHLTNSMFLGMARRIKQALGVPVVCSVQGEDLFLAGLTEPYRSKVHAVIRERARDVDAFVAPCRYYVAPMADYLGVNERSLHVVPLGVRLDDFSPGELDGRERPFVVGYLARICPEKGLHLLVESFRRLVEQVGGDQARLRIAGYLGERDGEYFEGLMGQIRSWGIDGIVDYQGELDRRQKIEFLRSIHVLSVPTVYREPKGLFALEALACAVPVVQPAHGAFPEIVEDTGGGLLVEPDSPDALTAALRQLMDDPERRTGLGRAGFEAVHRDYNDVAMAARTVRLYRNWVADSGD